MPADETARPTAEARMTPTPLDSAIERAAIDLSRPQQHALSAERGDLVDPVRVVAWTRRAERLLLYQWDESALRSEVRAVAERLRELLRGLPEIAFSSEAIVMDPASARTTLDVAMSGYTINAARQLGMAESYGSLEPGKKADFVVLDQNPFELDINFLHTIVPRAVLVGGIVENGSL